MYNISIQADISTKYYKKKNIKDNKGDLDMKQVKWIFLIYAILSAASIIGIGVAIAEKSIIGVVGSIIAVILIMGLGFSQKKKMRESGNL